MDTYTEDYMANVPVYMSYADLRSSVKALPARELEKPGKIYFKDNYLLIVEKFKGIHVIDVSNPANPKNTSFVEVPGCVDIAVKGHILYADSYVDLVAIDVSDISKIKEVNRLKDVYPYAVPPTDNQLRIGNVEKDKGVVIGRKGRTINAIRDLITINAIRTNRRVKVLIRDNERDKTERKEEKTEVDESIFEDEI